MYFFISIPNKLLNRPKQGIRKTLSTLREIELLASADNVDRVSLILNSIFSRRQQDRELTPRSRK